MSVYTRRREHIATTQQITKSGLFYRDITLILCPYFVTHIGIIVLYMAIFCAIKSFFNELIKEALSYIFDAFKVFIVVNGRV
jgi:hypothetical protein